MTPQHLKDLIDSVGVQTAVRTVLKRPQIHIFSKADLYEDFREDCRAVFPDSVFYVMGSGNLGFSIASHKFGKVFSDNSDVDLVVLSKTHFETTWEHLRRFHRLSFYRLPYSSQQELRRNGENVYSGFISPEYIEDPTDPCRITYIRGLNVLRNEKVGFRKVNALFFRNEEEAVDYYTRSFRKFNYELRRHNSEYRLV